MAPNSFVRLWDSQAPIFYEKRADQTGRPFLEVFEYKRKGTDSPTAELSQSSQPTNYEERLKALERQMETLRRRVLNEQSNADDTAVSAVQTAVSRRPEAGSAKPAK